MNKHKIPVIFVAILATVLGAMRASSADGLTGAMAGSSYYKVHPLFNPHPVEGRNYTVSRFGPVGIGIDLVPPGFTMKVRNVEPGSPAEGKLEAGQKYQIVSRGFSHYFFPPVRGHGWSAPGRGAIRLLQC